MEVAVKHVIAIAEKCRMGPWRDSLGLGIHKIILSCLIRKTGVIIFISNTTRLLKLQQ
jgi:hypothetical protein